MLGKSSTDSQGALMGFLAILTGNLDYMPVYFYAWISCSKGFPDSSVGKKKKKKSTCNAGDLGSIPGLGRSAGEGKGYPLQYPGLENSMNCIVHGVAVLDTTEQLSLSDVIKSSLQL